MTVEASTDSRLPVQNDMNANTRGLHVITWGCQMNVYDSARMTDVLAPLAIVP